MSLCEETRTNVSEAVLDDCEYVTNMTVQYSTRIFRKLQVRQLRNASTVHSSIHLRIASFYSSHARYVLKENFGTRKEKAFDWS